MERFIVKKETKNEIDINLKFTDQIKKASFLDIDVGLYLYDLKHDRNSFTFTPFEEYINDVTENRRSSYTKINENLDKLIGILVIFIIIILVLIFRPNDIFSIESIVALVSGYAIGKELWSDIENFLINLTSKFSVKFNPIKHVFKRENPDTLHKYFDSARQKRYGIKSLMPDQLDLIIQSNSKEVEMRFSNKTLNSTNIEQVNVLRIKRIDNKINLADCLLVFGIGLYRSFLGITFVTELFEVIDGDRNNKLSIRKSTIVLGRIKFYGKTKELADESIILKK